MYRIILKFTVDLYKYYQIENLVVDNNTYYKAKEMFVYRHNNKQVDKILLLKGIELEEYIPKDIDKETFNLLYPYTYNIIIYYWSYRLNQYTYTFGGRKLV